MNSIKNTKGVTLVEILLYIAIVSFSVVVVSALLFFLLEVREKNRTIAEVEQQGQFAMQSLSRISREAVSIQSPTAGSSGVSIIFEMPNASDDPTELDIQAGQLRLQEDVNSFFLTSDLLTASALSIENLTPTNGTGTARIEFTLSRNNPSGRNEYEYERTFETSITLRY